jgi:hypothetical protein
LLAGGLSRAPTFTADDDGHDHTICSLLNLALTQVVAARILPTADGGTVSLQDIAAMREEATQLSEQLHERDEQLRTMAGELAASRTAAEAAAAAAVATTAALAAAEADAAGALEATAKLEALQNELTACKASLRCAVRVLFEL